MKNKLCLGSLLFLSTISYSQHKIEKGSYLSNAKGQQIKLNINENNTYEVAIFYGDYKVDNDTIRFVNKSAGDSEFIVAFSPDANPVKGKVKVKLFGDYISYYYSRLFIGTQSGKTTPVYKNFSEFSTNPEANENELVFEINREDFFYLVNESHEGETQIHKFSLPRDANEIQIQFNPNYLGKIELKGFLNENKELVVSENSNLSPLVFIPENLYATKNTASVKPIETKKELHWTFAGKKKYYDDMVAVDTVAGYPASDFKLDIKDNLQKALEATKKEPSKFLVIVYDTESKNAKNEFDQFVIDKQNEVSSNMSYNPETDSNNYNFYSASSKDKSWLSKNKVSDNPSVIVTDGEGNILSQTKGTLLKNQTLFFSYGQNKDQLLKTKTLFDLSKAINSKAKETQVLKGFATLSKLEISYDSQIDYVVAAPDTTVVSDYADSTYVSEPYDNYTPNESVFAKLDFDKKKVLAAWESLVKSHSKDTKPNMDFVNVALAEVKGVGFYRHIFNEERMYDETNFKAIDYLLKHYDAILVEQQKLSGQEANVVDYYGDYPAKIDVDLPGAISNHILEFSEQASVAYKNRILEVYKKVLEKQTGDYRSKIDYFRLLNSFASSKQNYVDEYDAFFNSIFKGNNDIEILDEIYGLKTENGQAYEEWTMFKNYFSNASNEAAWFVVEKSQNTESVKKAIKWSESSLRIEKNNPYYLDTLAQLYYKNGEKQKAISTQEQAIKFSAEMDEQTKADLESVLEKMKNGTY